MAGSHLPPGFRFHPTDEELLVHYLKRKAVGKFVDDWIIGEIDIYKHEPAELPGMAVLQSRDSEWFFFNRPDRKQLRGSRMNRTTKGGYWKATGRDKRIAVGSCGGLKKTLIHYRGRAPHGERTDWVMHEYRLDNGAKTEDNSADSVVLCRIRQKGGVGPRIGDHYGAPVLEKEEPAEASNMVNDIHVLSSTFRRPLQEGHIQEVPPIGKISEDSRTTEEDFNVFLQNFHSSEELHHGDHNTNEDSVVDELFSLFSEQCDDPLTPSASNQLLDLDSCNIYNSSDSASLADNGFVMPEDMSHFANGQVEVASEHLPGLQVQSCNCQMEHLKRVGFLELDDLEEPCLNQSSCESAALENLLFELNAGMEFSGLTGYTQGGLPLQLNLQRHGHSEDITTLLCIGDSDMNDDSEVLLWSQNLSGHSELLLSDDFDLPSGPASSMGQGRGLALSHSQGAGAEEQPEPGHVDSDNFVENGTPFFGSVPCVRTEVNRARRHVNSLTQTTENANSEARSLADDNSRSVSPAPRRPSPSRIGGAISEFLGKMNALPASADELPVEWEQQLVKKATSLVPVAGSKARQLLSIDPVPVSTSRSLLYLRMKLLSPLQHEQQQIGKKPGVAPQWVSMFSLCITTRALALFWIVRGFCGLTRVVAA